MIQVIHYQNEAHDRSFETGIAEYYKEVQDLLPGLPETIQIYFSDYGILPDSGVGGYAYSPKIITVSIDPDFADKEEQRRQIRSTIFHEAFHVFQNYTGESGPFSAIDNAVYEGMATVFEREYCDIWQPFGDYRTTPSENLMRWTKDLQNLSLEEFDKTYEDWKFYHPEFKEKWIAYKVGTWIVDQVIKGNKSKILDLSSKTASEVLDLYSKQSREV